MKFDFQIGKLSRSVCSQFPVPRIVFQNNSFLGTHRQISIWFTDRYVPSSQFPELFSKKTLFWEHIIEKAKYDK
jgi:hypothetical protein